MRIYFANVSEFNKSASQKHSGAERSDPAILNKKQNARTFFELRRPNFKIATADDINLKPCMGLCQNSVVGQRWFSTTLPPVLLCPMADRPHPVRFSKSDKDYFDQNDHFWGKLCRCAAGTQRASARIRTFRNCFQQHLAVRMVVFVGSMSWEQVVPPILTTYCLCLIRTSNEHGCTPTPPTSSFTFRSRRVRVIWITCFESFFSRLCVLHSCFDRSMSN